jgi:hypothetical protein
VVSAGVEGSVAGAGAAAPGAAVAGGVAGVGGVNALAGGAPTTSTVTGGGDCGGAEPIVPVLVVCLGAGGAIWKRSFTIGSRIRREPLSGG